MSIEIAAPAAPGQDELLDGEALALIADLEARFGARRRALLAAREEREERFAAGERPTFPTETKELRESEWSVASAPADLDDRRVELTGPADPKMVINALNSGASVFMCCLEDALSPTWGNVVAGQPRCATRPAARSRSARPRARATRSASSSRRSSCGRAAGTSRSATCSSTGGPSRPACSTSRSSCAGADRRRWRAAAARTSTSRSSRAVTRPSSGTTSSSRRRQPSACRAARSAPRC